jgi:hypothetical protein
MDIQGAGGDTLDRIIDLLEHCGDGNDCLGVATSLQEQIMMSKGPEQLFVDENFLIEPAVCCFLYIKAT